MRDKAIKMSRTFLGAQSRSGTKTGASHNSLGTLAYRCNVRYYAAELVSKSYSSVLNIKLSNFNPLSYHHNYRIRLSNILALTIRYICSSVLTLGARFLAS